MKPPIQENSGTGAAQQLPSRALVHGEGAGGWRAVLRVDALMRNSAWNFLGAATPAAVAIPCMGILARVLGAESFGLLTLAWGLVGYFAVLDFGLARSVCWLVAQDPRDAARHQTVVSTAVTVSLIVSVAVGALLLGFSARIPALLAVSPSHARDALTGARLVILTLPLLTVSAVLQSYLEGLQRFAEINLQRSVTGVLLPVLPLAFAFASPTFTVAAGGILAARIAALVIAVARIRPMRWTGLLAFHPRALAALVRYGGWIAVSNLVYPIIGLVDRFWVSNQLGAAVVASYSAPAELISRATMVPVSISRALFPSLSASALRRETTVAAARRATALVLVTAGPIAGLLLFFSGPLLTMWLGPEIARGATSILRILAVGYLLSSLAQIPFSALQARGHSRATAIVHMAETIPYLALLVALGIRYGATGVAWAWTVRVAVDYLLLLVLAAWLPH